jgi:PadR family transcriptional regulator PadR
MPKKPTTAIATHIHRTSEDVLRVDHGSLYPALYRLKRRGWITASWETMPDRNREAKYYRLTAAGKKRLASDTRNGGSSPGPSAW